MIEPTAWVFEYGTNFNNAIDKMLWTKSVHLNKPDDDPLIRNIQPLYTHPVKQLSDERIMEIFKQFEQMQEYGYTGKKPFHIHLGWTLEDRNACLMLARAIIKEITE